MIRQMFCCAYCGAPTLRHFCRAHRDLPALDRPYAPRGILYRPASGRRKPHGRRP